MKKLLQAHHISFKNAISGIYWALTTQPNFRVHIFLSSIALFATWFFQIPKSDSVVIVFTIILGLSTEMMNTSLEAMTDLITTEWKKEAKIAKDVAAGMMLTVALGALVIAYIIFWPYVSVFLFRSQ